MPEETWIVYMTGIGRYFPKSVVACEGKDKWMADDPSICEIICHAYSADPKAMAGVLADAMNKWRNSQEY